ncbi:response regulator transcription factor [Bacillus paramycoides]|nr:response regulator transcription factor [Bacillus paramycoides]
MGKEDLISILIVDDHAIVRQGLNALFTIQPDFHVVGEAEDGEKAAALATELVPDIVLMDLVMPGINGVEAIRRVKQVSPRS